MQNKPQQPSDSTVIVAPAELGSATHPASQSPLINAEPTAGGFSAQAQSTGLISLQWNDVPGIRTYVVFRSTTPVFALDFKTVLTMDSRWASSTQDSKPNRWGDNTVTANTRYYYAVVGDTETKSLLVATGSCATPPEESARVPPPQNVPELGPAATSPTVSATSQPIDSDEAQREILRRRDGVTKITFYEEGQASNVPNGRYGFDVALSTDGLNLLERDDGEHHESFEIHKLADGRYMLIGYVSSDVAKKLKEPTDGMHFSIYSHRWTAATEFVCVPAEHLAHSERLVGEVITLDGNRQPQRIVGNSNRVMDVVWK